jgi:hypothetical protein
MLNSFPSHQKNKLIDKIEHHQYFSECFNLKYQQWIFNLFLFKNYLVKVKKILLDSEKDLMIWNKIIK